MPDSITPPGTKEDAFFILRASRELFQRRLVEIVRQSGVHAPAVVDAFAQEIAKAHDELASSSRQDGFEQTNGLTASRISLVGNDDLELEIRIGDIINRLKGNERIDRWRVQLRYMTLLNRPKMSAENNPAGLEPIGRGLWELCRASGASLDQNLDRLDRLEEQFQADLPDTYSELNALLESRGIQPTQVRPIQRASGGAGSPASAGDTPDASTAGNAISSLQQKLIQQTAGAAGIGNAAGASASESGGVSFAGNAALSASTLTMLNHLMERLTTLEQRQTAAQPGAASLAQEPLRAIRSKDLDLPLGMPATIALDTLSLIFDAIFATPDLPDVAKAVISRLQIPLLKVAIIDDTFFSNTQHPARQLINRIAHAACGLAQEAGRDHPVARRLSQLADAARATLEANDPDLKPRLDELERLISERDQAQQLSSQPYMRLVAEHEQKLNAKTHANRWLDETLARCAEPTIRRFLTEHGLRMMQHAAERGGMSGTRWQEARTTIDELLWSIQPKQTPEDRKRLVALVPSLIKRLNAELDALKLSAEERAPFLNACFDLQTAALRNRPDLTARAPMPPTSAPLTNTAPSTAPQGEALPAVEILERDGKLVQYLGSPTPPTWRTGSATVTQGNWIVFRLPDEEPLCGRHCGEAPDASGSVLLFNSDWGYAVALSRFHLEQQLADGKARILAATPLFDAAAEQALKQIARRTP
ncbi:MAG: DUF1631 family protein [Propionivibrio sp.]